MTKTILARLAIAATVALLAACNDVYTEKPLFGPEDAGSDPPLRTGVWLALDPKCQFDDSKPTIRWPKCADWTIVRPRQVLGYDSKDKTWTQYDYVLAAGLPRILQVDLKGDPYPFFYLAIEPVRLDDWGKLVQYRQWRIQCGQPPPPPAKGEQQRWLTLQPLPGMTPGPEHHADDCLAKDAASLRAAAEASKAWDESPRVWRWVRDAER